MVYTSKPISDHGRKMIERIQEAVKKMSIPKPTQAQIDALALYHSQFEVNLKNKR